jgi:hypothetical protein
MKKLAVVLMLVAVAVPAWAGDAAPTTLKGWITDSNCGAKNASAEGAACTKACYESGAKLVLYAGGKTYGLSDQKLALSHVGHEVAVTGTIDKNGNLIVAKMEMVKKAS